MLQKWLYSGDLHDPYGEFFVAVNPGFSRADSTTSESDMPPGVRLTMDQKDIHGPSAGTRLWESKYQFRKDLLPRFLGESFGKKVNHRPIENICLYYAIDILNWKKPELHTV